MDQLTALREIGKMEGAISVLSSIAGPAITFEDGKKLQEMCKSEPLIAQFITNELFTCTHIGFLSSLKRVLDKEVYVSNGQLIQSTLNYQVKY